MILEVALGIVLAVLVLAFLPQVLGLGLVLLLLGILAVGVTVAVLLVPRVLVAFVAGALVLGGIALFHYVRTGRGRALRRQIRDRKRLGYKATHLERKLCEVDPSPADQEATRRRALGYSDDGSRDA